ncbi:MAG: hypothetical protein SPL18_05490, partial [Oscillospiraceae bacterium]|nr:hypothetical protein [Oscillospiraceae bacterium]
MYTYEQRKRAVELYIKYLYKASAVIRELGYPNRHVLVKWFKEYEDTGDLHKVSVHKSMEMSRNVQSGNTQNLKSMVIQRSFPKWSVAERRKTAAASDQAAVCAC